MEAHRELLRAGSEGADLEPMVDVALQERIRRISARYSESLASSSSIGEVRFDTSWVTERCKNLEFAFRVVGDQVEMTVDMDFDDCDPLYAFAALREIDLCPAISPMSAALRQCWKISRQQIRCGC